MKLSKLGPVVVGATMTAALAAPAFAGTAGGRLSAPNFMSNGAVIFYIEGSRNSPPACATEYRRFALNASTPQGEDSCLFGLFLKWS